MKVTAESKEKVLVQEDSEQSDKSKGAIENETSPDKDLFRAIFKNSDSESSSDESVDEKNDEEADKEGDNTVGKQMAHQFCFKLKLNFVGIFVIIC